MATFYSPGARSSDTPTPVGITAHSDKTFDLTVSGVTSEQAAAVLRAVGWYVTISGEPTPEPTPEPEPEPEPEPISQADLVVLARSAAALDRAATASAIQASGARTILDADEAQRATIAVALRELLGCS